MRDLIGRLILWFVEPALDRRERLRAMGAAAQRTMLNARTATARGVVLRPGDGIVVPLERRRPLTDAPPL